jgi:hypothetical protein
MGSELPELERLKPRLVGGDTPGKRGGYWRKPDCRNNGWSGRWHSWARRTNPGLLQRYRGVLQVVPSASQCITPGNPLLVENPLLLEAPLNWNQTGPQGLQGASGLTGIQGREAMRVRQVLRARRDLLGFRAPRAMPAQPAYQG